MSESIKPCRLCGSQGRIIVKHNPLCSPVFSNYSVACSFCGAESGSYFYSLEAIDDWNELNWQVKHCA